MLIKVFNLFVAPASATNIRTIVLTPTEARVEWSTAPTGNSEGPDVWYEVHWRTEGTLTPHQRVKGRYQTEYLFRSGDFLCMTMF